MKKNFKRLTVMMMLGLVLAQASGVESRKIMNFPFWMSIEEETAQVETCKIMNFPFWMSIEEEAAPQIESRKIMNFPFWM